MKKRLFILVLIVLTLVAVSALAVDGIYVGTEKELNGGEQLNKGKELSKSIYYVDWIEPPEKLTALTMNNRVSFTWESVPGVDLYALKEKINGK